MTETQGSLKVPGQAALKPVFEGEDNAFLKNGTLEGGKGWCWSQGAETPQRLQVRVSRMKGHPGARELLGWPLPARVSLKLTLAQSSRGGLAWGREGRVFSCDALGTPSG